MLVAVILSLIMFLDFLGSHVVLFHYNPPKKRFRTLIMLLAGSICAYTLVFFMVMQTGFGTRLDKLAAPVAVDLWGGMFMYFFFYYAYFHQVVVFDRSVTPRIMVEIRESPEKKLSLEGLKSRYRLEDKIKRELEDMIYMKRLEKKGDHYFNTDKGRAHARAMSFLRDYLHIGGHQ